jgi:L-fuconolactonase
MPRIDAHHHVWDLAVRDQPWTAELPRLRRSFTFGELRPALRGPAIEGTVVVQTITVAEETPELLRLAAGTPEIRGVVGWADLTAPDVADRLARLRASEGGQWLVAIRHQVQQEPDPRWLVRPDVLAGLRAVAEAGLAYDLVVTRHQLPAAVEAAREVPQLRFVLDHAGKPAIGERLLDPWRADVSALAEQPNVAAKLSGLVTETGPDWKTADLAPYAHHLLDRFGADRVMFGSDWPVCTLRADYAEVVATAEELLAGFGVAERAAVFGGTAGHWYRLAG